MSHFIVFNYFLIAVQLNKRVSAGTTGKINFRSHYTSLWIISCVYLYQCVVMQAWVCFACVYVLFSPPRGLSLVTMRTAWMVTSLQQCDIIARRWLILLAHLLCMLEWVSVLTCVKMLTEETHGPKQDDNNTHSWHPCVLFYVTKWINFVLGA